MPKRIVVQTVLLNRDGQTVRPTIGKPFDFTDKELKELMAVNPDSIAKIINSDGPAEAQTIELTQAELDERVRLEAEKQRQQMEKDLRATIEAEMAAKNAPASDSKSAKTGSGKKADEKAQDDEI